MSVSDRQERIQIKDGIFMSRRRKRRNHFLGKFILLIGAVYGLILAAAVIYSTGDLKELGKRIEETGNPAGNQVDLSSLYSESAVLLDLDTGKIAAQKKGRERIYPASLTKMMTVLVVLENTEDLEQQVRLSEDIFPELYYECRSVGQCNTGRSFRTGRLQCALGNPVRPYICLQHALYRMLGCGLRQPSESDF